MSLIYIPSGKAREYSPLALNVYSGGCDHGCKYCYCAQVQRGNWGLIPKPRLLKMIEKEAQMSKEQILLSFISDPYNGEEPKYKATHKIIKILKHAGCSVAILSKGGYRCLADIDLFKTWPDKRFKIGATLTFVNEGMSKEYEPGAALPSERIETLKNFYDNGIQTWASIEPVIDAKESLSVIEASLPFVNGYKVGKLNHKKSNVNWTTFCIDAVNLIRSAGRKLYVKNDLRPFAPVGFLSVNESTADFMALPSRPDNFKTEVMLF